MKHIGIPGSGSDPFGEHPATQLRMRVQVLGGAFEFHSNSRRLLDLVTAAYGGLPVHRMPPDRPQFRIGLRMYGVDSLAQAREPPCMKLHAGAGFLCGAIDAANFTVISPAQHTALVVVSRDMLRRAYYARYELIEFAVYTLAARAQQLIPLHAGCVGVDGRGLLLIGQSGAGKSTIALHCLRRRMEFVSEDSTFVMPGGMLATGVAAFLHLRADSLGFLQRSDAAPIRKSPVIRRRSGIDKFEVDLRRTSFKIAPAPLELAAVVFLSRRRPSRRGANSGGLLVPIGKSELRRRLQATQPYAVGQPGWTEFSRRTSRISAFELRRGSHPEQAAEALQGILERE